MRSISKNLDFLWRSHKKSPFPIQIYNSTPTNLSLSGHRPREATGGKLKNKIQNKNTISTQKNKQDDGGLKKKPREVFGGRRGLLGAFLSQEKIPSFETPTPYNLN